MTTPADIWAYVLSNGLDTGQIMPESHERADELHLIHGLRLGSPLTVTDAARTAGAVSQAISDAGGSVTVERV